MHYWIPTLTFKRKLNITKHSFHTLFCCVLLRFVISLLHLDVIFLPSSSRLFLTSNVLGHESLLLWWFSYSFPHWVFLEFKCFIACCAHMLIWYVECLFYFFFLIMRTHTWKRKRKKWINGMFSARLDSSDQ